MRSGYRTHDGGGRQLLAASSGLKSAYRRNAGSRLGGYDFPEQATRVPALVEMLPAMAWRFQFGSVFDKSHQLDALSQSPDQLGIKVCILF